MSFSRLCTTKKSEWMKKKQTTQTYKQTFNKYVLLHWIDRLLRRNEDQRKKRSKLAGSPNGRGRGRGRGRGDEKQNKKKNKKKKKKKKEEEEEQELNNPTTTRGNTGRSTAFRLFPLRTVNSSYYTIQSSSVGTCPAVANGDEASLNDKACTLYSLNS